jgi:hypothetical protein
MSASIQQQQQPQQLGHQQEQQQQQADSWLLDGLPGPALRRVLQLASTPGSPALCRLACVSKAVRAAAVAAAEPTTIVKLSYPYFHYNMWSLDAKFAALGAVTAYHASLAAWLPRHAHHIRGMTVVRGDVSLVDLPDLLMAMAAASPDQAAACLVAVSSSSSSSSSCVPAAGATLTEGDPAASSAAASGCALQSLHLNSMWLSPALVKALVRFDQLQVLTMIDNSKRTPSDMQQLLLALPQLRQLHRLALRVLGSKVAGGALLRALPPGLRAVDLHVSCRPGSSSSSSSSLAHLVHLTSLRLRGLRLVQSMGPQGQQQALTVLAVVPEGPRSWFAIPSVMVMSVFFASSPGTSLAQLAACPHLRHLAVYQPGQVTEMTGVSLLTQLTRLRLGRWLQRGSSDDSGSSGTSSGSISSVGAELAALRRLQVLEVHYSLFAGSQQPGWLVHLHSLEQLVVFGMGGACDHTTGVQRLTGVIDGWHRNSSSISSKAPSPAVAQRRVGGSSSCSGLITGSIPAQCRLQHVQLTLSLASKGLDYSIKWGQVKQAAADMAAALPWLQVVAREHTGYTFPCWSAESEKQLG